MAGAVSRKGRGLYGEMAGRCKPALPTPFSVKVRAAAWHLGVRERTMDVEDLVQRAARGEMAAFVALTREFQHFAFGSALALVRSFPQAEDVVQEAFLAAWQALPTLAEPAAFPG